MIDISYTPPEPGYQPPYYRAASAVTLTCRVVGGTGRIRYRWTSTCSGYNCFVPSAGSYEYSYAGVSRSSAVLRTHDAGTHTCSAYESQGGNGSASTVMNVIGEYTYMHLPLASNTNPLPLGFYVNASFAGSC